MPTRSQRPAATTDARFSHPLSLKAFRDTRLLVGGYLAVSVLALLAVVLLRNDSAAVNGAVWTRCVVVVASAAVMYRCVLSAARGSRGAYRRLRILSGVMVVVITVIITLPGFLPLWMRIEQGACGLLLIGVALVVNGRHLRSLFAAGEA